MESGAVTAGLHGVRLQPAAHSGAHGAVRLQEPEPEPEPAMRLQPGSPPSPAPPSPDSPGSSPASPSQQHPRRRSPAAALIVLRAAEERRGEIEVLVGQIEVVDWVKSSLSDKRINPFPGEYRLPARQHRSVSGAAQTPLETVSTELEELGFNIPKEGVQATLFAKESVQTESRDYRILYFLVEEEDNRDVFRTDIRKINLRLRETRKVRREMEVDGRWELLARAEKERLSPKLHHLEWKTLSEVRSDFDPSKPFVNAYQQEEFAKYDVVARQPGRGMLAVLERIEKLGSLGKIREQAIENLVRTVAEPKEMEESDWRAQLLDDVDIMSGVNQISLLSYNLNALAYGATLFATGQGFASQARIDQFITRVEEMGKKKYDIIALQEVFATPLAGPLCRQGYLIGRLRKLGYTHVVKSGALGLHQQLARVRDFQYPKWTDSGLLILSILPIESSDDMSFTEAGIGLDAGAAKGVVYAHVRTVERGLHVFNCHLQATHTSGADYAAVRAQQLSALRDFITKKTFGTRDPWVLTGDFNIDAIAVTDEDNGEFGFAFQAPREESDAYQWLMKTISPRGDVVNLLAEANNGRHICTRPPRLSFPKSAAYAFKHKYPQCLDYIFFCSGSVGSIKRTKGTTRVEKFRVDPADIKPPAAVGLSMSAKALLVAAAVAAVAAVRLTTLERDWSIAASVLVALVNLVLLLLIHVKSNQPPLRYDYLSDHFGVSTTFSAEVTYNWQNLVPSGKISADKPVHEQRADMLLSVRHYVQLACSGSFSVVFHLITLPGTGWDDEMPRTAILGATLLLAGMVSYFVGKAVDSASRLLRSERTLPGLFGSCLGLICTVPCRPQTQISSPTLTNAVREPPKTVYDCLHQGVELYGNLRCLGWREKRPDGDLGEYKWMSYDEVDRWSRNFGSGLKRLSEELSSGASDRFGGRQRSAASGATYYGPDGKLMPMLHSDASPRAGDDAGTGLLRGDHVGIVSENCSEWLLVDQACAKYSLVSVPLETHGREFFSKLLKHSNARVIVASKSWMVEVINGFAEGLCPSLQFVVQIGLLEYDEQVRAQDAGLPIYSFGFVENKGKVHRCPVEQPLPDDVYTIAYRWHTDTCEPIGWEVTHGNLATNATGMGDLYHFSPQERHFSYVPMSHIGERVVIAACLRNGATIGISESSSSPNVYADVKKFRPTFLLSTPQIPGHVYHVALQALQRAPLRLWATKVGLRLKSQSLRRKNCWSKLLVRLVDRLIFRKYKSQLGGRIKRIFVLSDGTLNYMEYGTPGQPDEQLEKQIQIIYDCEVFKVLVLPEVGGFLAVTGRRHDAVPMGRLLHPDLAVKLKPLPYEGMVGTEGGGDIGELLLKGPSLSEIAKSFAAPGASTELLHADSVRLSRQGTFTQTGIELGEADESAPTAGGMRRTASSSKIGRTDSVTFDRLNWVHTGIICEVVNTHSRNNWSVRFPHAQHVGAESATDDSTTMRVMGRVSSIVEVGPERRAVVAEEVERIYRSRSKRIRQIWCHAPEAWQRWPPVDSNSRIATDWEGPSPLTWPQEAPKAGLCAVICIDHEQVYKWLSAEPGDALGKYQRERDTQKRDIMASAEAWYSSRGPGADRGSGEMVAVDAWRHDTPGLYSDDEWTIKYTLRPDTGKTYLRRLVFRTSGAAPEVLRISAEEAAETERLSEMEMVCKLKSLKDSMLQELQAVHKKEASLPDEAIILTVHLTSETFNAANKLQTPNYRLCRPNLLRRFSGPLGLALAPTSPNNSPDRSRRKHRLVSEGSAVAVRSAAGRPGSMQTGIAALALPSPTNSNAFGTPRSDGQADVWEQRVNDAHLAHGIQESLAHPGLPDPERDIPPSEEGAG